MDGRCATCKWWKPDKRGLAKRSTGFCKLAECHGVPKHPESLAVAWDDEEYSAFLVTDADFGCVQWESKE